MEKRYTDLMKRTKNSLEKADKIIRLVEKFLGKPRFDRWE